MPKVDIDYSKTIIYKICFNDQPIYIGSTTNFIKRKNQHKYNSINKNCPLYKTIRDYGGFEKFQMLPIEEFKCKNKIQAVIREQHYINELKPSLNINRAFTGITDTNNYAKQYKEIFKQELLEKKKIYYDQNKDEINKICNCECGRTYTHCHKSRHMKSKLHLRGLSPPMTPYF